MLIYIIWLFAGLASARYDLTTDLSKLNPRDQGCLTVPSGNYTGNFRPQIHFSPPAGFMNDPNGCFLDADGTWHIYYQYNPTGLVAGNQHWGHATSKDLYHWTNENVALCPTNVNDEQIFSGSIVIDDRNTSGLCTESSSCVIAIYTRSNETGQTQEVAFSTDGGYTFTRYANNPVLDIHSTQFRDPKVIWYNGNWVMVIAYSQEYTIGFYTSPNLITWTWASNFSHYGLLGLQWECPNLAQLPMVNSPDPVWVLAVSINPGAPLGGSIMQYFPGNFDGTTFTPFDNAARIADFGKDNYAGQFFYNVPANQNPVMIAWAGNWQYCNQVPTYTENWRSTMSLPRQVQLGNITRPGYDLLSTPYDLTPLYSQNTLLNVSDTGSLSLQSVNIPDSGALYFQLEVDGIPTDGSSSGTLVFSFISNATLETVKCGYHFNGTEADNGFWIDRGGITGFDNPFFTDKFSTSVLINALGKFRLEVVFDRTILEFFINNGSNSATSTFYPTAKIDTFTIELDELNLNTNINVIAWGLASTW